MDGMNTDWKARRKNRNRYPLMAHRRHDDEHDRDHQHQDEERKLERVVRHILHCLIITRSTGENTIQGQKVDHRSVSGLTNRIPPSCGQAHFRKDRQGEETF